MKTIRLIMFVTGMIILLLVLAVQCAAVESEGLSKRSGGSTTHIREFHHPRVVVHWHPSSKQLTLDDVRFALDHKVHAVELDVHVRASDGMVVCNHDRATAESPTLESAIETILAHEGKSATVHADGWQFFLVLEPKENSPALFDCIAETLQRHSNILSTSVSKGDAPRGITVVITGSYPREFYSHFKPEQINRLCIAETHDYSDEIVNLSPGRTQFQWVSIRYGKDIVSRVRSLHDGTDTGAKGRFNVRIWDGHAAMSECLAAGADSVNADRDEIVTLQELIARLR